MEQTFFFEFGDKIGPETNLFEAGLMDSFGFVQLLQFLEQNYGARFTDDDLASPRFMSLRGIASMVAEQRQG